MTTMYYEADVNPEALAGKKIAILIAPRGTEEPEFAKPHEAVKQAGATVTVIGLEAGEVAVLEAVEATPALEGILPEIDAAIKVGQQVAGRKA